MENEDVVIAYYDASYIRDLTVVSIMATDVLATQGAMILTPCMLTVNSIACSILDWHASIFRSANLAHMGLYGRYISDLYCYIACLQGWFPSSIQVSQFFGVWISAHIAPLQGISCTLSVIALRRLPPWGRDPLTDTYLKHGIRMQEPLLYQFLIHA